MRRPDLTVAAALSLCGLLVAVPRAQVPAASTGRALVVSADWLKAHLHDADVAILELPGPTSMPPGDTTPPLVGHVPGAQTIRYEDYTIAVSGLTTEMPPAGELRPRLEALGVSQRSHVVVVYPISPDPSGQPPRDDLAHAGRRARVIARRGTGGVGQGGRRPASRRPAGAQARRSFRAHGDALRGGRGLRARP